MSERQHTHWAKCPWCFEPVALAGYTCNYDCYEQFFIALGLVGPYLNSETTPPADLYDQPWCEVRTNGERKDEATCDDGL